MYRTVYKKSRKKKQGSVAPFLRSVIWVFSFTLFLWIAWVLWGGNNIGFLGSSVRSFLRDVFGFSSVFIPLFLLYWLWRSVKYKTLAFATLFLGMLLALCGISGEASFLRSMFAHSAISGGSVGDFLLKHLSAISGKTGAVLISLALILIGVHILFAIPWVETIRRTVQLLKNDFCVWIQARADLKTKLEARKVEEKQALENLKEEANFDEPAKEITPKKLPPKIMRPTAEPIKNQPRKNVQPMLFDELEDKKDNSGEGIQTEQKLAPQYELPPLTLLKEPSEGNLCGPTDEEIAKATAQLEGTLKSFDIAASVTGVAPGPVVTRYEIKPDPGVKISSIVAIANDIALAMKARGIRVEAPIPGKDAIGFEIPNEHPITVTVREILQDISFTQSKYKTTVVLGRYADGTSATSVIAKMPHLLVAGATNSGKSICVHTMIASILYRAKPDEVKLLLIDPKRVELTLYEGIPHLYDPKVPCEDANIVKDASGAVKSLQALVKVMEKRMKIFEIAKVKNLEGYNAWAAKNNEQKLFYVIVIIDEMADLMLQTKAAIEDSVQRLTQMGRALGIHLILCTQRPSTNVVTGVIKANLPSRIALQVASKIDSRVVLDANGADALLGKGDMLYLGISDPKPKRIQGAFISEEEIAAVAAFWRAQGGPDYPIQVMPEQPQNAGGEGLGTSPEEMLSALTLITERRRVSQDLLKAHFGSSARATNILSVLEMKGFITKPEGSNRWEIHYDLIENQIKELNNKQGEEPTYDTVYK